MGFLIYFTSGCGATSPATITASALPRPYPKGIYHTVTRGQTLWRIAKSYNADINDIIRSNRLADPSKIDVGQMLFIPGAKKEIAVQLKPPLKQSKRGYIWPIKGKVVSYYGSKKQNLVNRGIDIEAKPEELIVASHSGRVIFCDDKVKGLGKALIIDHGDGYSTLYANNSVNMVSSGAYVKQNQPIARAGTSGRAKTPTLHFEIRKKHKPKDPFYYLP